MSARYVSALVYQLTIYATVDCFVSEQAWQFGL